MNLPTIEKIENNLTRVVVGPISVWYSYDTPIAFNVDGQLVLHENIWSKTTGKHLNIIDNTNEFNRYNSKDFKDLWDIKTKDLMVSGLFA